MATYLGQTLLPLCLLCLLHQALLLSIPIKGRRVFGVLNGFFSFSLGFTSYFRNGFSTMFTATAFALTVHYNLPNSLSPMKNKSAVKKVVIATILTAMAFYWLIGAFCALFFKR
jgi:Transmembrane amino acid transporter protein.